MDSFFSDTPKFIHKYSIIVNIIKKISLVQYLKAFTSINEPLLLPQFDGAQNNKIPSLLLFVDVEGLN